MKIFLLLLFVLFSLPSYSLSYNFLEKDFLLCELKTATGVRLRNLRIYNFPKEKKCMLVYSKHGRDELMAKGGYKGFCEKKRDQIRKNLEKSLWKCDYKKKSSHFSSL